MQIIAKPAVFSEDKNIFQTGEPDFRAGWQRRRITFIY